MSIAPATVEIRLDTENEHPTLSDIEAFIDRARACGADDRDVVQSDGDSLTVSL